MAGKAAIPPGAAVDEAALRLHMPPQEGGDGLGQLVFCLAGGLAVAVADEEDQAQGVALGDDRGGYGGAVLVAGVGDEDAPLPGLLLSTIKSMLSANRMFSSST